MQLVSLNTWGGRVRNIVPFLENKKKATDIFCFQEVYDNAPEKERETSEERPHFFEELKVMLSDYNAYFTPQVEGVGLATFVRKDIDVDHVGSAAILTAGDLSHLKMSDGNSYYPRTLQYLFLKEPKLAIYNFHGVPGRDKRDTLDRDLQTKNLLQILNEDKSLKILTGDFNLSPDTRAVAVLEEIMQNPLKGSGFSATRNSLYKNHKELPFADYAFVSPEIKITDFQVLPDEISDHLALQIRFE